MLSYLHVLYMENPNQTQDFYEAEQFLQVNEETREIFEHQAHLAPFFVMGYWHMWVFGRWILLMTQLAFILLGNGISIIILK